LNPNFNCDRSTIEIWICFEGAMAKASYAALGMMMAIMGYALKGQKRDRKEKHPAYLVRDSLRMLFFLMGFVRVENCFYPFSVILNLNQIYRASHYARSF